MTMGQLDVVGDEVLVNLPNTSVYYSNNQSTNAYGKMNDFVLQYVHDNHPEINFSNYDNWSFENTNHQWIYGVGDHAVDYVIMAYRYVPNQATAYWFWPNGVDASGEATLGASAGGFQTLFLDGVYFAGYLSTEGSGCTTIGQLLKYSGVTGIMEHEMCHSFFVDNLIGGIDAYHSSIGLMTGVNGTCYNMSPYERSVAETGWNIQPTIVNSPGTYTLGDYIKTGQMLKIQIPGTPNEYYWIVNHQKVSPYDGIARGGYICEQINGSRQDPYCPDGKGLFIYRQNPGNCNHNSAFNIEQAEGKWNWYQSGQIQVTWEPGYSFFVPVFEHTTNGGNTISGYQEYMQVITTVNGQTGSQFGSLSPCSFGNTLSYTPTLDVAGEITQAYNMGYDEIFSPWSNPSSNSCANPTVNSGLTIKLLSQDARGNITVKIYYDDGLALSELPPEKPKNCKVSKFILDPNSGAFRPKVNWDSNREPDFLSGGHWVLYKGVASTCQNDVEPTYNYVAILDPSITEWLDDNLTLWPNYGGPGRCQANQFVSASYKIQAVDNIGLVSLLSDRTTVNGWANPCTPAQMPHVENQHNGQIPERFMVFNYPNPFNPATEIQFGLPKDGNVTIKVYNIVGEEVATLINKEHYSAGYYNVPFDGSRLSSGVYFYKIETGNIVVSKKMVLVK